jgi:hypothetical protein
MRVLDDLTGDRSHQQTGESARTARAQDDHVGVAGRRDELFDHSRARCEWAEPSTPTMIPGIPVSYCYKFLGSLILDARLGGPQPTELSGPLARDFGPNPWAG